MIDVDVIVVGAGGVGTVVASALHASGMRVGLHVREHAAERIAASGALVVESGDGTQHEAPIGDRLVLLGVDGPSARTSLIVFATKANALGAAVAEVARSHDISTASALGLQNGVWKNDALGTAFTNRVIPAATFIGAEQRSPGDSRLTLAGTTYLGSADAAEPFARALEQFGLGCEIRDDIDDVEWTKLCNAAAIFPISVLSRLTNPQIRSSAALIGLYLDLAHEAALVADAHGRTLVDLPGIPLREALGLPRVEAQELLLTERPETAGTARSSMLQDALAGRPIEHREVIGDLLERASVAGVPVPRLTMANALLEGIADFQDVAPTTD